MVEKRCFLPQTLALSRWGRACLGCVFIGCAAEGQLLLIVRKEPIAFVQVIQVQPFRLRSLCTKAGRLRFIESRMGHGFGLASKIAANRLDNDLNLFLIRLESLRFKH